MGVPPIFLPEPNLVPPTCHNDHQHLPVLLFSSRRAPEDVGLGSSNLYFIPPCFFLFVSPPPRPLPGWLPAPLISLGLLLVRVWRFLYPQQVLLRYTGLSNFLVFTDVPHPFVIFTFACEVVLLLVVVPPPNFCPFFSFSSAGDFTSFVQFLSQHDLFDSRVPCISPDFILLLPVRNDFSVNLSLLG